MEQITEKTWMPIGLAVVVIGGGAVWLTSLYLSQAALASSLASIKIEQSQYLKDFYEMKTDIAVIKNDIKKMTK